MDYRAYKLVNRSELEFIEKSTRVAFDKWMSDWCDTQTLEFDVQASSLSDIDEALLNGKSNWTSGKVNADELLAISWSDKFPEVIFKSFSLIGHVPVKNSLTNTNMASKLLESSIISLIQMITETAINSRPDIVFDNESADDFIADINKSGSGYILLTLTLDSESHLDIAINANSLLLDTNIDTKNDIELTPAINVLGNNKVELQVSLGSAELDIKSITGLTVGDVITFDKSLNEKFTVFIDQNELCDAYLGESDGKLAIKIDESI